MSILQLHFFAVSAWIGVLALETVIELYCRHSTQRLRVAAGIHVWGDRLVEAPLLLLATVSGVLLLAERWPGTPLLWLKIGMGLSAVLVNVYCLYLTHARNRAEDGALAHWTSKIAVTGYAIPVVLGAFALGLSLRH